MAATDKFRVIKRLQRRPQLAPSVTDTMQRLRSVTRWAGLALGLLVSPAIVVFAAPFGYGILHDLITQPWVAPAALTIAAALAMNAARRGATVRDQAAKSMT